MCEEQKLKDEKFFELEKHLHEQYAVNNNSNLGSLIAILTALIGIFAVFGYVFVNSTSTFAPGLGHLTIPVNGHTLFHLDVLLLAGAATLCIISILYKFSLYLGVDQRKEQFLTFAIRLKYYEVKNKDYTMVFPQNYCPMGKKGIHNIAQGLYGKICNILLLAYVVVFCLTIVKTVWRTCYCVCSNCPICVNEANCSNCFVIAFSVLLLLISLLFIICSRCKAKTDYTTREDEYKGHFKEKCPYRIQGANFCNECDVKKKKTCKFCKWFATFLLILALPATIFAQVDEWDGGAVQWTQGSGTQADPYLIETAENLAYIAQMVNGGVTTYSGVWFRLTTDLNMRNVAWTPIGNSSKNFCGKFNGDGHLIDSVSVSGNYSESGLFGITGSQCLIENLRIMITITRGTLCGGVVGKVNGTTVIQNCQIEENSSITSTYASTSSTQCAGGVVGWNANGGTKILNCKNYARVGGTQSEANESHQMKYGGILGGSNQNCTIEKCSNSGRVEFRYTNSLPCPGISCGGICGHTSSGVLINMCFNTASIIAVSSAASSAAVYCGGIYGGMPGNGSVQCTNCYNTGSISALRGYMYAINNSKAGGICGATYNVSVSNCYNTGHIDASTKGGICGYVANSDHVQNCYYKETSGGTTEWGTAMANESMKSESFPVLLNTDSVVFVMDFIPNVNSGYPIFGYSVCEVTTLNATNLTFTSATLNGSYIGQQYWQGGTADVVGFEWKEVSAENYNSVYTNTISPISYNLANLQPGTEYQYRMFLQKNGALCYGNIIHFSTLQCDVSAVVHIETTGICDGDSAVLTAIATSSLSDEFDYLWGNGSRESAIVVTEEGVYTVIVIDGAGCETTASTTITVNPLPVGAISGNTTLCNDQISVLTASGANRYNWSTGSSNPTITVSEGGTYVCTFTNSYNCSSTQSVEVSIFSSPVITGETAFCTGGSTTLTATGGTSYTWSTGATTPTITVSQPGTYTVTGSSAGGCTGSSSVTVVENPLPTVEISGYPVICSGIGTELTATEGSSYLWSTGEDTRSITANHTGNFSVLVTDANGCSNTTSVEVTALSGVAISGNTNICQGESTTLSVEMEGNYLWSTGAQTALITVSDAGYYSVTVSLPNGCSASANANVSINPQPVPTISGNTTICQGESATLTANGGVSYRWSNNATAASISVGTSGLYSVTVTNAQGCSASTFINVTVNPLPTVTISGNTSTCQGSTTTLTANGAQSYQWNTGSTNASISVGAAGNFTVTGFNAAGCSNTATAFVTIYPTYNTPVSHAMCQGETYNFFGQNLTNAGTYSHTLYTQNGCDSVITLTLTVRDLPVVAINGNTTICQGETATLVATGGTSYQWSTMGQGNSITVTEAGTYTVTATNAQGCSATASTYVTVNPLPNITISGNTAVCQGNTTTLVANGATTYQWSNGVSGAVNTIGTFGIYTVTGISAEGCSNTASATVVVYQLPVLNISGDTQLCSGETTTLTANGAATYLWNNGTTDAALTTGAAGTYTVIGTDEHGCYSTASIDVSVNYPSSTEVTVVECDSYEWQGITRTESGDYTWTGQTAAGCDSIITLHLTINESVTTEISETASNSYEWHGTTYTESGDYTWTGQTSAGCDSTVTLHLTITTGVNEWGDGHFTVYPNPTTGMVNVRLDENGATWNVAEIQIFDVYGRLLNTVETCHGASLQTTQIDLSSYAPGIYLIKLVGDGRVIGVRKVVKR